MIDQCIIYCNSVRTVTYLGREIVNIGIPAYFIHSKMEQEERNLIYHNFSKKKCKILVSTDITTRGIDIPSVNVVINYELPFSSESYLHRVGRAGRFGAEGCCINLVSEEEKQHLDEFSSALNVSILPGSSENFKKFFIKR